MNLLFLTMSGIRNLQDSSIYTDLLRKFRAEGHTVYVASPIEKRMSCETVLNEQGGICLLQVKVGNLFQTSLIEKGISTLRIESQFKAAIQTYFSNVKFDVVLYSTPPITFAKVIEYIKRRDGAKSYLLLKDIFPQNAVDLWMFPKKSPIYALFRAKEKKLYTLSDFIGCMSQANVDFVLRHNPIIDPTIVHVSPNTIKVVDKPKNPARSAELRKKYGIPVDRPAFVYGGNLGQPQGISFLIECLKANEDKVDRFFVICGNGTEYPKLKAYVDESKPSNVLLINGLPKEEYEDFIQSCDVGLIFLDHRFTISNFPSRLLSYLQNRMPVLACTDPNTDIGKIIDEGGFGWWCESNSVDGFTRTVDEACCADLPTLGDAGYAYLTTYYTVEKSYEIIMEKLK